MLLAGVALALAACGENLPLDTLDDTRGPIARKIDGLFTPVMWIAVGVFVVVEGLIVFAIFRFRRKKGEADRMPKQTHGNARLEIGWTILPTLLLAGVGVPSVAAIFELATFPPDAIPIEVRAHQWWWQVCYPTCEQDEVELVTANEIHIPTGERVVISLVSDNVIHSFWVPRLAGKIDVVPARTNQLQLEADVPGTYLGQCAEFCGLSHANMRFRVIADTPEGFEQWKRDQAADPAASEDELVAEGREIFEGGGQCATCHSVDPTAAAGVGPNLAHFGSRQTFAGSMFENDTESLEAWLRDPPAVKPGSKMPDYNLSEKEIDALVAYLQSLE